MTQDLPPYLEPRVVEQLEHMMARDEAFRRFSEQRAGELAMPAGVGLGEFLAVADDPVLYRITDVLPVGGNALLAAQFKAGKSTLVANLLRSLVDGDPFLGCFAVEPPSGRIVLLDNELDERMLRRWLREQGIENVNGVEVFSLKGKLSTFNILDDAIRARWAAALAGASVLIFDPLRPAMDALGLDENHDGGRFLQAWDALKSEAGADESVVVHHVGHGSDRARGDSRLLDWPDALWKITKEVQKQKPGDIFAPLDDGGMRFFAAHGRDVLVPEGLLQYRDRRLHFADKESAVATGHAAHIRPLIEAYVEASAPAAVSRNKAADHLVNAGKAKRDPAREMFEAMFGEALANPEGLKYEASYGPKGAHQLTWKAA